MGCIWKEQYLQRLSVSTGHTLPSTAPFVGHYCVDSVIRILWSLSAERKRASTWWDRRGYTRQNCHHVNSDFATLNLKLNCLRLLRGKYHLDIESVRTDRQGSTRNAEREGVSGQVFQRHCVVSFFTKNYLAPFTAQFSCLRIWTWWEGSLGLDHHVWWAKHTGKLLNDIMEIGIEILKKLLQMWACWMHLWILCLWLQLCTAYRP